MTWHMELAFWLMLITSAGNLWTSKRQWQETRRLKKKAEKLAAAFGRSTESRAQLAAMLKGLQDEFDDYRNGVVRTDAGKPGRSDTVAGALR